MLSPRLMSQNDGMYTLSPVNFNALIGVMSLLWVSLRSASMLNEPALRVGISRIIGLKYAQPPHHG